MIADILRAMGRMVQGVINLIGDIVGSMVDAVTFVAPRIAFGVQAAANWTVWEIRRGRRALIFVLAFLILMPLVVVPMVSFIATGWFKNFLLYMVVLVLTMSVFFFSARFFNLVSLVGVIFDPTGTKSWNPVDRWWKTIETILRFILGILAWEASFALYCMVVPIDQNRGLLYVFLTAALVLAMGSVGWGFKSQWAKKFVMFGSIVLMALATVFFFFPWTGQSLQRRALSTDLFISRVLDPRGYSFDKSFEEHLRWSEDYESTSYRDELEDLERDIEREGRTVGNKTREQDLLKRKESLKAEFEGLRSPKLPLVTENSPVEGLPEGTGSEFPEEDEDGPGVLAAADATFEDLGTPGGWLNLHTWYFWFCTIIALLLLTSLYASLKGSKDEGGWHWTGVIILIVIFLIGTGIKFTFEPTGFPEGILVWEDPPRSAEVVHEGITIKFGAAVPSVIPTGVIARPGQTLQFESQGRYLWEEHVKEPWVGPKGASWTPMSVWAPEEFPLPNSPIASVIGWINGRAFYIGDYKKLEVVEEGELFLGLNERQKRGQYHTNKGEITVLIQAL